MNADPLKMELLISISSFLFFKVDTPIINRFLRQNKICHLYKSVFLTVLQNEIVGKLFLLIKKIR